MTTDAPAIPEPRLSASTCRPSDRSRSTSRQKDLLSSADAAGCRRASRPRGGAPGERGYHCPFTTDQTNRSSWTGGGRHSGRAEDSGGVRRWLDRRVIASVRAVWRDAAGRPVSASPSPSSRSTWAASGGGADLGAAAMAIQ
jgi:hypothetical protein